MLILTCEEYIEHKHNNGIVDQKSRRTVCFVTDLWLAQALIELRKYQLAYRQKWCPDGYNGTVVEYRLLGAAEIGGMVKRETLTLFGVQTIYENMADELQGE